MGRRDICISKLGSSSGHTFRRASDRPRTFDDYSEKMAVSAAVVDRPPSKDENHSSIAPSRL